MYFNTQHLQSNQKNRNNMESLTLQVDGPIAGRAYKRGLGGGGGL